jgi:hypothetical protein
VGPGPGSGVEYDPSRALTAAHRLLRPQGQRVQLTLNFNLARTPSNQPLDALHGAPKGSSMAAWERSTRADNRGRTSRACPASRGG